MKINFRKMLEENYLPSSVKSEYDSGYQDGYQKGYHEGEVRATIDICKFLNSMNDSDLKMLNLMLRRISK